MRVIDLIVVHCAATKGDVSAATIRKWHTEDRGWRDIGYHFVIRKSGNIELGRPLEDSGAHVAGRNKTSIGICLAGGYGGICDYTPAQWRSLEILVGGLLSMFPGARVAGHNEFTKSKTCPNFNVKEWARKF